MYRADLAIGTVLPIESWVCGERVAELGSFLQQCWWLRPVAVIPRQEDAPADEYILVDDHQLVVAAYLRRGAELTVLAQVCENMEELRAEPQVRHLVERCGFTTLDAMRKAYEEEWRHELAAENVYRIADLAQPRNRPRRAARNTPGLAAAGSYVARPFAGSAAARRWVREA